MTTATLATLESHVASETEVDVPQHSPAQSLAFHLLPALPSLIAFTIVAAVVSRMGLPATFALYLVITFVEVPLLAGLLIYFGKKEQGTFSLRRLFPYHRRIPVWMFVVVGLPLLVWSLLAIGVSSALGSLLAERFFSWIPDSFVIDMSMDEMIALAHGPRIVLWILAFFGAGILGGLLQELYFRGFLLPRIAYMGKWGPLANALLFGVYHFHVPWNWLAFGVMTIPWAYAVYWRRSIWLAVFAHSGMLLVSGLMMGLTLFGVVQLPSR